LLKTTTDPPERSVTVDGRDATFHHDFPVDMDTSVKPLTEDLNFWINDLLFNGTPITWITNRRLDVLVTGPEVPFSWESQNPAETQRFRSAQGFPVETWPRSDAT